MKNWIYWILAAWLSFLALSMLAGCKTKSVVEVVQAHDTLRVSKTDTIYKVRTDLRTDTLRIETERTVTLSPHGDTLRVTVYRDRWRDRVVRQTDTVRAAKTDTIYRAATATQQKETVKRASWWERWGVFGVVMGVVMGVCVIAVIAIRK